VLSTSSVIMLKRWRDMVLTAIVMRIQLCIGGRKVRLGARSGRIILSTRGRGMSASRLRVGAKLGTPRLHTLRI
jgi:hypothetical protein